ncbi:hypothetical protein HN51_043849 [Arachis hypogaea]|uniref:BURP domain-containing protein n=1 Tax=Arachis hypogaea TaxID=3818 RepID=A0A444Y530_ARAHY|nr:unknown seed protein USP [Arachis ipaensis]XP_025673909.1 unknown seed protein USP [Arachis hypogaea]QHN95922.1 Dehydration-responsive protein [Arachis hypogaea]RYQ97018.1 hypothetical protein Ahy_B08g092983 isoform A [Arachis hypogaea]
MLYITSILNKMESSRLLPLSALFCIAILGSHVHASLPAEDYWQTLWPNTPMPKAFKDLLLQPGNWDWMRRESAHVKQQATTSSKLKIPIGVFLFDLHHDGDKSKTVYDHGKESEDFNKTFPLFFPNKYSDHLTSNKPTIPNGAFFFEHDLLPGKKLILGRIKTSDEFTFLPDTIAKAIPFSSNRLPEIFNRFNIEAESTEAESMKKTLALCEGPTIHGEERYCATSLESLLHFAVSKLGKNIRLLSTEFERETQDRQYTVAEGVKKNGEKAMVCHKMNYPYAVFFCHKIDTRSYSVPLMTTNDGTKLKAIVVCHTDTAHWPSNNVAFKMLNTKPGTTPICHFLATDDVIWVPQFSGLKDDM